MRKGQVRLAKRLDEVGFSDIVVVRNRVMELRGEGKTIHAFHGGEPFFDTPDPVKFGMVRALVENRTKYAASSGLAPLREALAEKLKSKNGIAAEASNVILTSGGAHAIYAAFQAVLDPGDDVLLFSPYWTPIRDMVTLADKAVADSYGGCAAQGNPRDAGAVHNAAHPGDLLNTPQNPSGTVFTRGEAEEVAAFAKAHNVVVIADEAYEDLVYDGEHFSIASLPGMAERTISAFTFSKTYAMTGWRVGYAVANEPFMTGLRKLVLYSTNGVSTASQWAALEALSLPESHLTARREEHRRRRDLLVNGLNEIGLECPKPPGAFYAFPSVTKINKDSRKAAATLLDKAHVSTVPGVVFGAQGEGHVRFGFSVSKEAIEAGLEALRVFMKGRISDPDRRLHPVLHGGRRG